MKRKIIKQGHNTLTLTLPSKWAKKHGVKYGDEIDVTEQGKTLFISAESRSDMSKTTVDISGIESSIVIWRYILSAYRAGYEEIIVTGIEPSKKEIYTPFTYNTLNYLKPDNFATMSPIETVSACVNRLIGMEIVEQGTKYCIIKDMGETSHKEFDSALKRMFLLLRTEAEIISNGLEGQNEPLKSIHIIDTNLDRFEDFCLRVLNKKGYKDFRKTSIIYNTVFTLEIMGDEFKKIARHLLEMKENHSSALKKIFKSQYDQLQRFYMMFYKFDKRRVQDIYIENENSINLAKQMFKKLNQEEIALVHHFNKIGSGILSLTELKIDLES
ncbi:MAG: hypothetical protein ABIH52_02365 [Candidatus Aenigmatarchaeota archaeon]